MPFGTTRVDPREEEEKRHRQAVQEAEQRARKREERRQRKALEKMTLEELWGEKGLSAGMVFPVKIQDGTTIHARVMMDDQLDGERRVYLHQSSAEGKLVESKGPGDAAGS